MPVRVALSVWVNLLVFVLGEDFYFLYFKYIYVIYKNNKTLYTLYRIFVSGKAWKLELQASIFKGEKKDEEKKLLWYDELRRNNIQEKEKLSS